MRRVVEISAASSVPQQSEDFEYIDSVDNTMNVKPHRPHESVYSCRCAVDREHGNCPKNESLVSEITCGVAEIQYHQKMSIPQAMRLGMGRSCGGTVGEEVRIV